MITGTGIMKRTHLAILKKGYLAGVVAGLKTVELRLSKARTAPFGRIAKGDRLFLKESAGPVVARAAVDRVVECENLTPAKIASLQKRYNKYICASDAYWSLKSECKYASLIWLRDVKPIKPRRIEKHDQRAWVILSEDENFGLFGKAIR